MDAKGRRRGAALQAFEYLLQLAAILIGLALADLAISLHRLIRARQRVGWHWHPLATAAAVVLLILDIWWGMRVTERAQIPWTIGLFLPLLVGLLAFFLLAAAALPDDVPDQGLDLRAYYAENSRYFWIMFAAVTLLFTAHSILISWIAMRSPDLPRMLLRLSPNFVLAGLACSLAFVRRPWWHSVVLILLIGSMLASYVMRPLS